MNNFLLKKIYFFIFTFYVNINGETGKIHKTQISKARKKKVLPKETNKKIEEVHNNQLLITPTKEKEEAPKIKKKEKNKIYIQEVSDLTASFIKENKDYMTNKKFCHLFCMLNGFFDIWLYFCLKDNKDNIINFVANGIKLDKDNYDNYIMFWLYTGVIHILYPFMKNIIPLFIIIIINSGISLFSIKDLPLEWQPKLIMWFLHCILSNCFLSHFKTSQNDNKKDKLYQELKETDNNIQNRVGKIIALTETIA